MPWVSQAVWSQMAADREVLAALVREQMATIRDLTARAEASVTATQDRTAVRLAREEAEGVAFPEDVMRACAYYAQGDAAEEAASLEQARNWLAQGVPEGEVIQRIALGSGPEMAVVS